MYYCADTDVHLFVQNLTVGVALKQAVDRAAAVAAAAFVKHITVCAPLAAVRARRPAL